MDCEYREHLSAFYDGELPGAEARAFERHLATCPACAAELAEIRELAENLGDLAAANMSPAGMARVHAAADAAATELQSPVLRIAAMLGALAASVLVVGSAWLWDAPPATSGTRPATVVVAPAAAPEWERVAMTLEAGQPAAEGEPVLADARFTNSGLPEARVADWMLRNLSR